MTESDTPLTVVLAEDEAIIRLDVKETLEDEGYVVVGETGRGDEVVDLVRRLGPDVAILDIKMPGQDGIEVARKLTAEQLTAVVLLTAYSQRDLIEQARDAGALTYLVKPFQRTDLIPAIEMAIARHRDLVELLAENRRLGDKLEQRKLIDRAKGRLMDERGLSEADAFSFLQKTAMHQRRTMVEVAADVLDGELAG